ncbi:MAG: hypothetical protein EXS10_09020 [Phycisphaerales bacterium]|nr:hypothetical protein [Phycisphaerales bacterium]
MRHLSAALVGTVVVFMWGFLAWAALGIWDFAFVTSANQSVLMQSIDNNCVESGAYVLPAMPECSTDTAEGKATWDSYSLQHQKGPLALVLVQRVGTEAMAPLEMAKGFVIEFIAALLLTCVLSAIDGGFKRRAGIGLTLALFAATAIWGVQWNFMHLPTNYVLANWLDVIVAWTLGSCAISFMLSRKKAAA